MDATPGNAIVLLLLEYVCIDGNQNLSTGPLNTNGVYNIYITFATSSKYAYKFSV